MNAEHSAPNALRVRIAHLAPLGVFALWGTLANAQTCGTFGPDGHWYQAVAVPGGIAWESADAAARATGGMLVSITSAAENQYVFSLIDKPDIWGGGAFVAGPWIGGVQIPGSPEPLGGWTWTSGEPFAFDAWTPGEPNNGGGLRQEDRICFWSISPGRSPTWNDYPAWAPCPAYVVEWDADPRPAFASSPDGTTTCLNASVVFTAPLSTTFPALMRWRKNGVPLEDSSRIAGAQTHELTLIGVRLDDEGVYDCVATHACASAVSGAAALMVCAGDFNCSEGTPDDADITDFFEAWNNGEPIADLNNSEGVPDDADVVLFFSRWNQGC